MLKLVHLNGQVQKPQNAQSVKYRGINMKTQRITRESLSGVKYQIEYTLAPKGTACEYRVRRGDRGSWTAWIRSKKITNVIKNLGFTSAVNDFAFEALLTRGQITLNKGIVAKLAGSAGTSDLSRHIYSRLKRSTEDTWTLPSRAIVNEFVFKHLENLIRDNT